MVKIRSIRKENYNGQVYDLSLKNAASPYFYANRILTHNSLYPHIMIQCNLYGRNKKSVDGWHGSGMWDVEGYYDDKTLSPVGRLIRAWYHLRLKYKRKFVTEDGKVVAMLDEKKGTSAKDYIGKKYFRVLQEDGKIHLRLAEMTEESANEYIELAKSGTDRREYTVKIIINTIYGILNNAYYKLVYDLIAGGDCTRIGRQWTKYARKVFREAGYKVIYTDTDSWYIVDPFNDKKKMLEVNQKVIDKIKETVPFPQLTFDAGIDDEIKYMFFFKGTKSEDKESDDEMDEDDFVNKSLGFMKKNYIYVTKENKVTIKNLGIKKKNISALSKEIFWKHIVPQIISDGKVKFSATEIENVMRKLLKENIELAYMRKEVAPLSAYAKSMTGIQAQISKAYGPGIHFLIPNKRGIGVGKKIKYCSVEEFKKYNMDVSDISFDNFWKELNYFVINNKQPTLFEVM